MNVFVEIGVIGVALVIMGLAVGYANDFDKTTFDSGVGGGIFLSGIFVILMSFIGALVARYL